MAERAPQGAEEELGSGVGVGDFVGLERQLERVAKWVAIASDGDACCTVSSELAVTVTDSMSESEHSTKAVGGMFAQTAAALAALKTYVESNPS